MPGWLSRIADSKLIRSMSRKGCSPDNAPCEGFFGRSKIKMFFSRDWLHTTTDEFIAYLDTYIRWCNEARIKVSLGARSPIEHREAWEWLFNQSKFSAARPPFFLIAWLQVHLPD